MYVKVSNGAVEQYPYTLGNLRRDNPNTSFPKTPSGEMLADWGVYPVTLADVPSVDDRTQKAIQDASPTLVDGSWTLGWTVESKTSEEVQAYDDQPELSATTVIIITLNNSVDFLITATKRATVGNRSGGHLYLANSAGGSASTTGTSL